jgi:transcriptional regulator with XRE-family HTH domain
MSTARRNWTGRQVKNLRIQRGQSQTAFGLELYDTTDGTAQSRVSEIERGDRQPSSAVRRTLQRMEEGEI